MVGRLADVADGQSGGGKVSFQRWVLGRYLENVLVAASKRLGKMSRRALHARRQREASDLRRASGLDLAVEDSWYEPQRPAITLSGGESFLAALSLALGLAETVQARHGAVSLETIFVDEGFGALDPRRWTRHGCLVGLQATPAASSASSVTCRSCSRSSRPGWR